MTYLICIAVVVLGLLAIFAKDFMWGLTQFSNEMKGVASDRTDTWDTTTTIAGIVLVLAGVITFIIGLTSAHP
jgi:UPF0716 family protein affecting phage T7 exclusion